MENLNPWYRLNIDISNAISENGALMIKSWKSSIPGSVQGGYWKLYHDTGLKDFFNKEFLESLSDQKIPVDMMVSFYRKPHYCHPTAHIDGSLSRKVIFGLNWIVADDDDSEMVWYEMPKIEIPITTTEYGTAQVDIDVSELAEIGRCCVGNHLTLVQVNVPHNVIVREKERFVISLRCRTDTISSWSEAVEFFKPFIKQ